MNVGSTGCNSQDFGSPIYNSSDVQYVDAPQYHEFKNRQILNDVIPSTFEEEDDDDFLDYDDLFMIRRQDEQPEPVEKKLLIPTEELRCRKVAGMRLRSRSSSRNGERVQSQGKKQLDIFVNIFHPEESPVISDETGEPAFGDDGEVIMEHKIIDAHVLIDSGCTSSCIDAGFVKRYDIPTEKLPRSYPVFNADGTSNDGGRIKEYVTLEMMIGLHREWVRLAVTSLASSNIFLGHDWLKQHNPEINWATGQIF